MSVAEIKQSIDSLDKAELVALEKEIHAKLQLLGSPVIYDDDYGKWTEDDQNNAAAALFDSL